MFMDIKKGTYLFIKKIDCMVSYVKNANKTQVSLYIGMLI